MTTIHDYEARQRQAPSTRPVPKWLGGGFGSVCAAHGMVERRAPMVLGQRGVRGQCDLTEIIIGLDFGIGACGLRRSAD
jgi:hypothetical protein